MTRYMDIATRTSVLTLKAYGISTKEVASITGISVRTVNKIFANAVSRGFNPEDRPMKINNRFVEDAPKSGRPKKQTPEVKEIVLSKVRDDCYGREKTCANLAGDLCELGYNISRHTVWRILRASRLQEDEANEKAWVDEEDEG
ncbi:hypothetical protein E4U26_006148 [Claviceps purpurea]|nr:hypothetical protein E4U26_006148 [Claviceps purpurea]KAG6300817.1 hypothetical protein E4U45_003672 [Claviceps purpurea]